MTAGRVRIAWLCLASLAVVAPERCQVGQPASEVGQPELEFTVVGALEGGRDPAVTIDSVAPGRVMLSGVVGTPTPCHGVSADVGLRDGTLTLTLVATAQPGAICVQVIGTLGYQARISGLSAGRYTLEVVARYPGSGWESRVERLEVEIP